MFIISSANAKKMFVLRSEFSEKQKSALTAHHEARMQRQAQAEAATVEKQAKDTRVQDEKVRDSVCTDTAANLTDGLRCLFEKSRS